MKEYNIVVVYGWREKRCVVFENYPTSEEANRRYMQVEAEYCNSPPDYSNMEDWQIFLYDQAWIDDTKYYAEILCVKSDKSLEELKVEYERRKDSPNAITI